jgi:hypothetical protein
MDCRRQSSGLPPFLQRPVVENVFRVSCATSCRTPCHMLPATRHRNLTLPRESHRSFRSSSSSPSPLSSTRSEDIGSSHFLPLACGGCQGVRWGRWALLRRLLSSCAGRCSGSRPPLTTVIASSTSCPFLGLCGSVEHILTNNAIDRLFHWQAKKKQRTNSYSTA